MLFNPKNDKTIKELVRYLILPLSQHKIPKNKFFIFGEGRNGSSLLTSLLNSHNSIHCDGEILARPRMQPKWYINSCASYSHENVYGFKLLFYHITDIQKISDPLQFLTLLCKNGYKMIYLSREDIFRQSISNIYARSTNRFHEKKNDKKVKPARIYVDPQEAIEWLTNIYNTRTIIEQLLGGFGNNYLHIKYESDLENSQFHQLTVDKICKYLEIPSAPVKSNFKKITPFALSDFIENHEELISALEQTRFAKYINN